MPTVPPVSLLSLADEPFVSLTTYRRSGVAVSTPVWIARDGDALIVFTPHDSGKVKRLRHDARVELRPCGRMGKVDDGAPTVAARAGILSDDEEVAAGTAIIKKKYGAEFTIVTSIEKLGKEGRKRRVILRITD